MIADRERFETAIARIDAANAEDPEHERVDGESVAKELIYGRRMSEMLDRFAPGSNGMVAPSRSGIDVPRWKCACSTNQERRPR